MVYVPLNLPNGTTLTAEHLRHVEQGIVGADNERVITLNASSSAQDFQYAYTIYSTESAQVSYSDGDGELCSLIGVQDIGGEPTYYFLKPSKDRHIIVKTNTDTGAVTITKNSVGVIKISLNADAGTLSAEDLLTLSKNPERVVFERDGFYYFAENLSSTTTWFYSCNVYWGANGQIIKRVVEVTTSTGAYKKSDYPYTPANTTYSLSKSGNSIILTGSDGSSTSVNDADTNTTYEAAGAALGLVKSGGDVTIADGVITVKDDSHNHVIDNVDGLQDALNGKADQSDYDQLYDTITDINTALGEKANASALHKVATSGSYNDLTNKPTIPSAYTLPAAGSALGGVKSGGDVTISDGVITVNDNSHNHSNYTATSVVPNNSGEIKTKYRVAQKGDAGRTAGSYWYYKLCDLPTNDAGNYASAIISGRIGGWTSGDMSYINALVWNRGIPGIALIDIAGAATAISTIWDTCELVLYANSVNTATLYAKCYSWFTFDLDIEVFQSSATITYDGTHITTTPTGTFADSCSKSAKRLELVAGGLYVNGSLVSLMEDLNSFYGDSQSYTDDKLKEATDYTDTRETEIKKYADGKTQEAKRYADEVAAGIVGSAPETLNALNELASALGNDPNFATTVSNQIGQKASQADLDTVSGDVDALKGQVSGKLDKTTYEASKELALGSNGKVCLGKFGAYDTNITIEINSTTHTTYHATIVISTQNVVANGTGGTVGCYVYDDADNHITPLVSVFRPYGSASRQIEVYADLPGWSKNLVHVQGVAISDGGMTDVLTSVETIPTAVDGKIKVTPVNVLIDGFASKAEVTTLSNQIGQKASQGDVDNLSADVEDLTTEVGKKANTTDVNNALAKKMSIDTNNGSYTNTKTYISHHPENGNGNIIPFIYNDIGHLLARGGGAACSIYTTSDTSYTPFSLTQVKTVDATWNLFDGSPSYQNNFSGILTGSETLIIDVTCHKTFYWSNTIYIDFGNLSWTPSSVKIFTSTAGGTYTERKTATGFTSPALFVHFDSSSAGFNRIRFVLEKAKASLRVAQIGVINYGSSGATETLVSRGGSSMFGSLIPYNNYGANLGGLTNQWNAIYGSTIYENGTALSSKYASKTELGNKADADKVVTLNDTQTIPSNKTHTGYNTFLNNLFAIRANNVNDDSWINLTNSSNGAYYAFGIRRPYGNYGLQMKYHPDASNQDTSRPGDANGTGDIYYDIYHQGNYTRMPTATTSAPGLMSASDKTSLNNIASNYVTKTQFEEVLGASLAEIDTLLGG